MTDFPTVADADTRDFYLQVTNLLKHPGNSKTTKAGLRPLSIVVSEGSQVALEAALRLAAGRVLLFIYVPIPNQPGLSDFDLSKSFFTCPLDDTGLFESKTNIIANLLPESIEVHVGKSVDARYNGHIDRIHQAVHSASLNHVLIQSRMLIQMRNSLWNLPAVIHRNVAPLPLAPDAAVAIICGAGPSLKQQVAWLKTVSDRAIVVCVGHALPVLLEAGVNPDVVVEGDPYSYRNWPDAISTQSSILVALSELSPEVVARFRDVCWCEGGTIPFVDFCKKNNLPMMNVVLDRTVTIHAMDVVIRSGIRNVVLMGQDLSLLSSGQMYADESHGERGCSMDAVMVIPGNDVPMVPTNCNLKVVKEAIEEYIQKTRAMPGNEVCIMNVTRGGARINGALRVDETAVAALLPRQAKAWPSVERTPSRLHDPSPYVQFARDLRQIATRQEVIIDSCRKLSRALDQPAPSPSTLARLQRQLKDAIQEEDRQRNISPAVIWANLVLSQADLVTRPHPSTPDMNAPAVQLDFLNERYRFSVTTLADMAALFTHASTVTPSQDKMTPPGSPRVVQAFRNISLRRVKASNREYADWLDAQSVPERMERFRLYFNDQFLPWLEFKQAGEWVPFTAFLDMNQAVMAELSKRLAVAMNDPHHSAVVVLCPGNWAHPALLGRSSPQLPMAVVDPWPDLFSCLCDHVCFINELRRDTIICGLHGDLKAWPQLLQNRVRIWKEEHRQVYFFIPESVARLPEGVAWCSRVEPFVVQAGGEWV